MPAAPPALAVLRLIDDDAVDPGAEGGLAAKAAESAKHPEEHFLRQVQSLVGIAEKMEGQRVDHALVRVHEVRAGAFVADCATFDEGSFSRVYVGPTDSASVLH